MSEKMKHFFSFLWMNPNPIVCVKRSQSCSIDILEIFVNSRETVVDKHFDHPKDVVE